MITVTICKGLPASGKSTWAKEKVSNNPGMYKRVNKDDLREMLDCSHWSKSNEKFVNSIRDFVILEAIYEGKHVIVDDTNLHHKHEDRIKEIVKHYNEQEGKKVQVKVKFFEADVEECIKRDIKRSKSVGEKVIRDMYNKFLKPEEEVNAMEQDRSLKKAIICDLDGTLSIMTDRGPYEGDKCASDIVNEPVRAILEQFKESHHIILVSGRPGSKNTSAEPATRGWLLDNAIHFDMLIMRGENDVRKDSILKREMFDDYIKGKFYIDFVLDDRNQVVDMWREMGLTCLQVAPGNF